MRILNGSTSFLRKIGVRLGLDQLGAVAGQLLSGADQLPRASSYLEEHFLKFQTNLEELLKACQALITHGGNVVSMAGGTELGEVSLDGVITLLESPLNYLSETDAVLGELTVGLRGSLDAIKQLIEIERTLEAAVAPLQITQFMFRIECAYLPSEQRQVFNSVVDEIATLQAQIQAAFQEHAEIFSALHNDLRKVVEALEQQMASHGRKVREKKVELSRYLAAVSSEIKQNAQRDVALTHASKDLRQKVSAAVVELQVQDRIAQQLEHARSGIGEIKGALEECRQTNNAACFEQVTAITRVEIAQLDGVLEELWEGDRSLRQVFSGIGDLLEKLDGEALMLKEFGQMTASTSGMIQGLLESLEEIRGMVAVTVSTTRMAEASVVPVRNAIEHLTNTVQTVAQEMHLIALNAQIQAIQMGGSTGLDVLAAHSAEVSRATTKISVEVAAKVEQVASAVTRQSDALSALCQTGQRQQQELDLAGPEQEAKLHKFRDGTLREFRETGEALDQARKLGAEITSILDFQPAVERVEAIRLNLAEFHSKCESLQRAFPSREGMPACFRMNVHDKYTMASERRIHLESLGRSADCESAEAIEFWDQSEPAADVQAVRAPIVPVNHTVAQAEDFELF